MFDDFFQMIHGNDGTMNELINRGVEDPINNSDDPAEKPDVEQGKQESGTKVPPSEYVKWLGDRDDLNRLLPNVGIHHLYNKYVAGEITDDEMQVLNKYAITYLGQPSEYAAFVEETFDGDPIVCYIGKNPYKSFESALNTAQDGDTITLSTNVIISQHIILGGKDKNIMAKKLSIDFGGHSLVFSGRHGGFGLNDEDCQLNLINGTMTGSIEMADGLLNINRVKVIDSDGIVTFGGKVNISDSVINAGSLGIGCYSGINAPVVTLRNTHMAGITDKQGQPTTGCIVFGYEEGVDPMEWNGKLNITGGTYDIEWLVDKNLQAKLNTDTVVFIDEKAYFVNDNKFGYKTDTPTPSDIDPEYFNYFSDWNIYQFEYTDAHWAQDLPTGEDLTPGDYADIESMLGGDPYDADVRTGLEKILSLTILTYPVNKEYSFDSSELEALYNIYVKDYDNLKPDQQTALTSIFTYGKYNSTYEDIAKALLNPVNEVKLEIFNKMYLDGILEKDSLYSIIQDEDNFIYEFGGKASSRWYIPNVYRMTSQEISQMAGKYEEGSLYIATDSDKVNIALDADNLTGMEVNTIDYYSFVYKTEHDVSRLYFIEDDNVYIATGKDVFEPYNVDPDVNDVTLENFNKMFLDGLLEKDSLYSIIPDVDNYIQRGEYGGLQVPTVRRGTKQEIDGMAGSYNIYELYINTDSGEIYTAVDADTLTIIVPDSIDYYTLTHDNKYQVPGWYFIEDYNVYIATAINDFEPYKNDNSGDDPADEPVVEGDYIEVTKADFETLAGKGHLETDAVYHITGTETYYIATSSNTYEPYTPKPKE